MGEAKKRESEEMKEMKSRYHGNVCEEAIYIGERLLSGSLSFYLSLTIGQGLCGISRLHASIPLVSSLIGGLLVGSSSVIAMEMSYFLPLRMHTFIDEYYPSETNTKRKKNNKITRRKSVSKKKDCSNDNFYGLYHHHQHQHRENEEEAEGIINYSSFPFSSRSRRNSYADDGRGKTLFSYALYTPHHPTPYHLFRTFLSGLLCFSLLGGRFASTLPSDVTRLGAYYFPKGALPATAEYGTGSERITIQTLGRIFGCHTCGVKTPQSFIADHMPPKKIVGERQKTFRWSVLYKYWYKHPQVFVPQCNSCSSIQSGAVKSGKQKLIFHWNWQGMRRYHGTGGGLILPSLFGIEHNLNRKQICIFSFNQKKKNGYGFGFGGTKTNNIDKEAYQYIHPYIPLLNDWSTPTPTPSSGKVGKNASSISTLSSSPSVATASAPTKEQYQYIIKSLQESQNKKKDVLRLPLDLDSNSFNIFEDWLIKKSWAIDCWFVRKRQQIKNTLKEIKEEWES